MSEHEKLRIPQAVIDSLVTNTDIVSTIGRYLPLKKQGRDYICLCPFHKESSPSFSVSPGKQFYYCFGCGAGGNSMNFLQEYLGKSFISVIQEMADDNGVDLTPYLKMAQQDAAEFKLLPAMAKASTYFQQALQGNNARTANEYLAQRGITAAAAAHFALGYAGSTYEIVQGLADIENEMILGGILERGEKGIFSLFRQRVMMPVRDIRGKTIGLSGRTLEEDVKPKYKNSKESQLFSRNSVLYGLYEALETFGKDRLEDLDVVEGQVDVISEWQIGRPACAAMGSSLSPQQLRLLLRHAKNITFMFDGDAAGVKAMIQVGSLLLEHLTDHEHTFKVVILPEGDDPHSLIQRDVEQFHTSIAEPMDWLDALFQYLPEAKELHTDRGRAEYASRCIELIHDTRDPLLRHQAIEKAAKMCGFPVEAMNERLLSLPLSRSGQAMKSSGQASEDAALRLTRMLWDEPKLVEQMTQPTLWVEEGDGLVAVLGEWAKSVRAGECDAQYTDAEAQALLDAPERMAEIDLASRYRVAGAALGRRLTQSGIPGLMEQLMKEEPEQGASLANSYIWHITGTCAGRGMQSISEKARLSMMTDDDRARFASLMVIRRDAANRVKE
jgi:DNA primase